MRYSNIFIKSLILAASIFIISGCAAKKKAGTLQKKMRKDEYVILEGNVLKDPVSNYSWTYFNDNPTTFYRFKLNSSNSPSRLPTVEELTSLLEKIGYQFNDKKDHGNIRSVEWFNAECDFLTSSSIRTNEGEVLYEVVHWNPNTRSSNKGMITGGDLVFILILN